MYENKYPEVDDVVMVRVKSIADMGAYVSLLEYNNIEGMILLSELSRRRIRSITKLIRVGRQEPVVVLRVDKEKGYIDLSKRRVMPDDVTRIEEKYSNSKTVHSIMMHVAKTMHQDVEKLYQEFCWPLYAKHGHAIEAFKLALVNPEPIFAHTSFSPELREAFVKNIKRRLAPQAMKMRADVEVTCFAYEGIDAIRAALEAGLKQGTDEIPISIKLVAPPLYVLLCQSLDKTQGLELLDKSIQAITAVVREKGGDLVVKVAPRSISEREDRELSDYMGELERQNTEVSGDDEDDGSESESDSDDEGAAGAAAAGKKDD